MMNFEDVYTHEHATRKFLSRKVSEKLLARLIQDAQNSPSLLNSQPWHVYAVMGDARINLCREYEALVRAGKHPQEDFAAMLSLHWDTFPSQNMVNFGASQSYFFRDKLSLFTQANDTMFNAPVLVYLTIPKASPAWSIFDLGIFAQSLMLLAINKGLAVIPAHSLVAYPELVRKYAQIPDNESVGMAIGIGYADCKAEVNADKYIPKRLPLRSVYRLSK